MNPGDDKNGWFIKVGIPATIMIEIYYKCFDLAIPHPQGFLA